MTSHLESARQSHELAGEPRGLVYNRRFTSIDLQETITSWNRAAEKDAFRATFPGGNGSILPWVANIRLHVINDLRLTKRWPLHLTADRTGDPETCCPVGQEKAVARVAAPPAVLLAWRGCDHECSEQTVLLVERAGRKEQRRGRPGIRAVAERQPPKPGDLDGRPLG